MDNMVWVWLAAVVVLTIAEAVTVQLVAIWFIFGGVAALIAAVVGADILTQVLIFVFVSALLLIFTRHIVKKYVQVKVVRTNADSNIGKVAVVTADINNELGQGMVKVGGIEWTARSQDDSIILKGEKVRVEKIEGVKLIVSKLNGDIK